VILDERLDTVTIRGTTRGFEPSADRTGVLGDQLGHVTDRMSEIFYGKDRERPSRCGDIDVSRSAAELIDRQAGCVADEPAGIDQIDNGGGLLADRITLVIESPRGIIVIDEPFVVGDISPPREVPDVVVEPTHLGHVSHLFEVGGSSIPRIFPEPAEGGSNVDEARTAPPYQRGMTAPFMTRGIVDQTGGHRVSRTGHSDLTTTTIHPTPSCEVVISGTHHKHKVQLNRSGLLA
jgi:hypothetical protein